MKFKSHLPVILSFIIAVAIVGYYLLRLKRLPSESEVVTASGALLIGFGQLYQLVVKFLTGLNPEVVKTPAPPALGVLLLAVIAASCATFKPVEDGLKNIVIDCTLGVQPALLPVVESDAAAPDPKAAFEGTLKQLGGADALCVLNKAVADVLASITSDLHLSPSPLATRKATALQAWLDANPTPPAAATPAARAAPPPHAVAMR